MPVGQKLAMERRARLAAERLLAQKQADLDEAQALLSRYAREFSAEIKQTRAKVESYRHENARVKTDLRDATQKAQAVERRLWHAIASMDDGFVIYDQDDKLVMANETFHSYFRGLATIKPGMSIHEVVRLAASVGIIRLGGETPEKWQNEMLLRRSDPQAARIISLRNGRYIRVIDRRCPSGDLVSLFIDITDSVQAEHALKDAQKQAETASRAKSAFLANMSHELRTPMNGVVGMADLLRETELSEEQRVFVDTIRGSGQALLTIINDVLDYSKIDADQLELRAEPFDLEQCIHDVLRLLQPAARKKGLALLVDYDLFLPTQFLGDTLRIRQIFTNLIGNAVKFTETGHIFVQIVGSTDTDIGTAHIHASVQDTGIGIPLDQLSRIFARFHQVETANNRGFEGTGLGLAITKRLVEQMQGEIWVDSEVGQGANFGIQIELPLDPAADMTPPQLPQEIGHVLVVDDHATNRALLEKRLSRLGANATGCSYNEEAMPHASNADLILAHHEMPDSDSFALASTLREQGLRVPILVFASAIDLMSERAETAELRGRLGDPFTDRELLQKLTNSNTGLVQPRQNKKLRVLAADDNKTNRLVLEKMLQSEDIELTLVTNGLEAVKAYEQLKPDVILMDISMPEMDGREATERIRAMEDASANPTRIIALTAHAADDIKESLIASGLDDVLTKPLNKRLLIATLDNLRQSAEEPQWHQASG